MILSTNCIKPDPEKLAVIKNVKAPNSAKLLKPFLGLTGFYRRFIRGYAQICEPFRPLLKKNAKFEWTETQENAFQKLKQALTSAPICLTIPNWNDTIALISDSSRLGCGYMITNVDKNGVHKVITYGGHMWNKHDSQWSVSELELAGILYAIEANSQYFIGRHFKIYTDDISNTRVNSLIQSQDKLYRWS